MLDDKKLQTIGQRLEEMMPAGFYGNVQFNFADGKYQGGCVRMDFTRQKAEDRKQNNES